MDITENQLTLEEVKEQGLRYHDYGDGAYWYETKDGLLHLITNYNPKIRAAVASNPNTPHEVLRELTKDQDRLIRDTAASNPNTPFEKPLHDSTANNTDTNKETSKIDLGIDFNNPGVFIALVILPLFLWYLFLYRADISVIINYFLK